MVSSTFRQGAITAEFGLCLFAGSPGVAEQEIWAWLLLWISSKQLVVGSPSLLCTALALWCCFPNPTRDRTPDPPPARTGTARSSHRRQHSSPCRCPGMWQRSSSRATTSSPLRGARLAISEREAKRKTLCGWLCPPPLSSPHLLSVLLRSPHPPSEKMLWVLALLGCQCSAETC